MWLPTPIYERTPQLWVLMAVLFVVLAAYIGFDYLFTYFYILLGVICGVRGAQVWRMRRGFRRAMQQAAETASQPAGNQV